MRGGPLPPVGPSPPVTIGNNLSCNLKFIGSSQDGAIKPARQRNLGLAVSDIKPEAPGPVAAVSINGFGDPIPHQGLQIAGEIVVSHQAEAAHGALKTEEKFRVEPDADPGPDERFNICCRV